ncbi:MAG: hypothetical protein AAFQ68_17445, partial [Bacteroidota bacterium]
NTSTLQHFNTSTLQHFNNPTISMTSFHSKHFPSSKNGILVLQSFAMQYIAGINVVLMLGILVRVVSHGADVGLIWFAVIGELIAVGLGNLLAYAKLKKTYAQIFFVNEHFSLISVYEILFKRENNAFPLRYANPRLDGEQNVLSIHFNDQIITLRREDWEEFDLIRDYLFSRQF